MADVRLLGTTHERPADRLAGEGGHLGPPPAPERLAIFLREMRTVGCDEYVRWDRSRYGVSCEWAGQEVLVGVGPDLMEIQPGTGAYPPIPGRARRSSTSRCSASGAVSSGSHRLAPRGPLAVQIPSVEVERCPLAACEAVLGVAGRLVSMEKARLHLQQVGLAQAPEVLDSRPEASARTRLAHLPFRRTPRLRPRLEGRSPAYLARAAPMRPPGHLRQSVHLRQPLPGPQSVGLGS